MTTRFEDPDFVKKVEAISNAIKETVSPVMDAVKNYSDSLQPFFNMTSNDKDTAAKENDYLCLKPDFVKRISDNIANSFTSFINILADSFTKEDTIKKMKKLPSVVKDINSAMTSISKIVKKFNEVLKAIEGDNKTTANVTGEVSIDEFQNQTIQENQNNEILLSKAPLYAILLSAALHSFINIFDETLNGGKFKEAAKTSKDATEYLKNMLSITVFFNRIVEKLNSLSELNTNIPELLNSFDVNLNKITDTMISQYRKTIGIDFTSIIEAVTNYHRLSVIFRQISDNLSDRNLSQNI